jgi:hypothetical protein
MRIPTNAEPVERPLVAPQEEHPMGRWLVVNFVVWVGLVTLAVAEQRLLGSGQSLYLLTLLVGLSFSAASLLDLLIGKRRRPPSA